MERLVIEKGWESATLYRRSASFDMSKAISDMREKGFDLSTMSVNQWKQLLRGQQLTPSGSTKSFALVKGITGYTLNVYNYSQRLTTAGELEH